VTLSRANARRSGIAALFAAAMLVSSCTGAPAPSSSSLPSPSDSAPVLPEVCAGPASPPTTGEVAIVRPTYRYADEEQNVRLQFVVQNTTDRTAWGALIRFHFEIDGEDVTDEFEPWSEDGKGDQHYPWFRAGQETILVPSGTAPEYWKDKNVEFTATITVLGWCTPKEPS